jgi:hypothetical protein
MSLYYNDIDIDIDIDTDIIPQKENNIYPPFPPSFQYTWQSSPSQYKFQYKKNKVDKKNLKILLENLIYLSIIIQN